MIKFVLLTQIFALFLSILALLTKTIQKLKFYIASSTALSAILSILGLINYISSPIKQFKYLFRFLAVDHKAFGVGIVSDALSVTAICISSIILSLTIFYAFGYIKRKLDYFLINVHLLSISFIFFIASHNLMQMHLSSAIMTISSYFLISFESKENQSLTAFKMLQTNLIADVILLFGFIILFVLFGTLNFEKINTLYIVNRISVEILEIIALVFIIPILLKLSQLGFWLSSVAKYASIPTSAIIHSCTLATSGIFFIIRLQAIFECSERFQNGMISFGLISATVFGIFSITSNDIRKILSYLVSSSIGVIIVACGFSTYGSAILIYATQAFSKALLFLAAGSVIHALSGEQDINKMGGLFTLLPKTYLVFILSSSTLISIPLLPAYYSGKVLFNEIVNSESPFTYIAIAVLMLNFVLTACSLFRLIYRVFHTETKLDETCIAYINEDDKFIIISMYIMLFLALFSGIVFYYAVYSDSIWKDIFPFSDKTHQIITFSFMIVSGVGTILAGFLSKFIKSYKPPEFPKINFKIFGIKYYNKITNFEKKHIYFPIFRFMNNTKINIISEQGSVQYILSLIFIACCYVIYVLK